MNIFLAQAYTVWPKKHTLIFHLTAFSFDYCVYLLCIASTTLCNITFITIKNCIKFWLRSCIDNGIVKPFFKANSITSQRLSEGLRTQLYGDQFMCENDFSCSLNHSFTIWAHWIWSLSSYVLFQTCYLLKATHENIWITVKIIQS